MIPFASHEEVDYNWKDKFSEKLEQLGRLIDDFNTRVSMHPGQYTVLNSDKEQVRKNAVAELKYHTDFLEALNRGGNAKITLHIGGVYGNKQAAKKRFINQANRLPEHVKNHLIIENDENSYHIFDLLEISSRTDLPVVFDLLHHQLNSGEEGKNYSDFLPDVFATWTDGDGPPIVHFSSKSGKTAGHHSRRIDPEDFLEFINQTQHLHEFDVMLECKDKELALLELREKMSSEGIDF